MAYKEKIDYLLIDVRELEKLIAGIRDAEMYPVSFFSQSFELTHKILKDLHALETAQVELLRKQMEEHEAMLKDLPYISPLNTSISEPLEVQREPEEEILTAEIQESTIPHIETDSFVETVRLETLPGSFRDEGKCDSLPEAEPQQESDIVSPPPIASVLSEKVAPQNLSINEVLEKRKLSDFRKAFSLNDRFYFRRELFGGNEGRMNQVIERLNELSSYDDSLAYLKNELEWNLDDQAVADFIKLLEKRFV